ncbi:SDR family NAD(P)-dependent oxidoreductase [Mucilaginibacter aquariorum]|uniref:SDR family oxidoreductase n=1 Tax=Mucilaginibacter aquariorum TaxID=2967225 RepID=A0ABT1SZ80_9SPHI|nr:SDR family oxidoreductase [Mucilaginibacter aquariorum]MCQ6957023.1 SDR family oxidoreductase [Mucilaginibacter aquariorum]
MEVQNTKLKPGTRLQNKIALITGANSGIGLAAAKRFASEGAYVYITGRRQPQLDEAVAAIGQNVTGIRGDVTNMAELDHIFSVIASGHGRLDIVFANAGLGAFEELGKITEAEFDRTFDVNVKGTLFTVQKALPFLSSGASIILTGSTSGIKGIAALSVYCATKAAIRNFARSWSLDLKGSGIRVNVLSPGATSTPGWHDLMHSTGFHDEGLKSLSDQTPLGRIGDPSEIAAVALFLASDESSFMTGSEVFVDGGLAQV